LGSKKHASRSLLVVGGVMGLLQKLEMRQGQSLVMTPQLL
jgi:hypothetical protein